MLDTTLTANEIALESVMRAARSFAGITAESVAQTDGLTAPQLRVLVLASTRRPLTRTEVAEVLDVHFSDAGRTCDRLLQAGLRPRPRPRRRGHRPARSRESAPNTAGGLAPRTQDPLRADRSAAGVGQTHRDRRPTVELVGIGLSRQTAPRPQL